MYVSLVAFVSFLYVSFLFLCVCLLSLLCLFSVSVSFLMVAQVLYRIQSPLKYCTFPEVRPHSLLHLRRPIHGAPHRESADRGDCQCFG